jgi:hypothetical protein
MGGSIEMVDKWFGVQVSGADEWNRFAIMFDRCKEMRQHVARRVLGHTVTESDADILCDMMANDISHMTKLLALLEEKAG